MDVTIIADVPKMFATRQDMRSQCDISDHRDCQTPASVEFALRRAQPAYCLFAFQLRRTRTNSWLSGFQLFHFFESVILAICLACRVLLAASPEPDNQIAALSGRQAAELVI